MPLPLNKNAKYLIRMEQIARYRLTGRINDKQIASLVGLTPAGLALILKTPEYQELENALLEGQLSKMDEALAENVEAMRSHFKAAVPAAMRTLLETVQQRRDLRSALSAAKEILDRDPDQTFSTHKATAPVAPSTQGFNPGASTEVLAQITVDGAKVTAELKAQPAGLAAAVEGMANNGQKKPEEPEGQGTT